MNKQIGFAVEGYLWEILNLIKGSINISIKTSVQDILKEHIFEYAKRRKVSKEVLKLIEKKLKAAG